MTYSEDRKGCITKGCKGTLPAGDDHKKCSNCRKSRLPVLMTKQERVQIREKIAADKAEHARRVSIPLNDPLYLRLNPSIAWMFQ